MTLLGIVQYIVIDEQYMPIFHTSAQAHSAFLCFLTTILRQSKKITFRPCVLCLMTLCSIRIQTALK